MTATLRTVRCLPIPVTGTATVTVVITCYNYARYLAQATRSVLDQDGIAVEVIIVDDASTDASLTIARELASIDVRVRVIANEHNLGAVGAFNRGATEATGEFLVRLDADDLLTPGSLARAVAVLQAFPEVSFAYGHPLHFVGDKLPAARTAVDGWYLWNGRDWLTARCHDGNNVITSPEVVMRRKVLDQVGGMRQLAHTHDMELWLRLSAHGDVAYVAGADQAWHRDHPSSLSKRAADPLVILREIRDAFDVLFDGLGPSFTDGSQLHALARRAVALEAIARARRVLDRGRWDDSISELADFARAVDPTVSSTAAWRYLFARERGRPAGPLARALGMLPRLRRRLRLARRQRRWHRTGVYEPLSFRAPRPSWADSSTEGSTP